MKPPLAFWIRAVLAVLVFVGCFVPIGLFQPMRYLQHGLLVLEEATGILSPTPHGAMGSPVQGWRQFPIQPEWLARVNNILMVLSSVLVPFWAALAVHHRLTFRRMAPDRLTRCGQCGFILKNLERPACPACTQAI